ncbi:hypothetical protein FI667_g3773, partial [Globisporangium splendens]
MDAVMEITKRVEAAKVELERLARSSNKCGDATLDDKMESVASLQRVINELHQLVTEFENTATLDRSKSSTLMEAGIILYNASRNAFKAMPKSSLIQDDGKNDEDALQRRHETELTLRNWIVTARFWACKIMSLSLVCSKSGGPLDQSVAKNQPQYLDECIDVLRSFGRVGALFLESAKLDFGRCQHYLKVSEESFSCCFAIWSQLGLSHLTKLKQDIELEEIMEDLWDFSMDRIRVLQLLFGDDDDGNFGGSNGVAEALTELQMLAPYMPTYKIDLLKLVKETSEIYKKAGRHQEQIMLTEEALRLCDSLDACAEPDEEHVLQQFKQSLLVNVLDTFGAMKDYQRAETCYSLLPQSRDSAAVLTMAKIYIEAQVHDKAIYYLKILFQLDNLEHSIQGARLYAQAQSYNDNSMKIYEELERNYGENKLDINLDLAYNLAFSEVPEKRERSISELKRVATYIKEDERNEGGNAFSKHVKRIHQTVFDATQHHFNLNAYELDQKEDALEWANRALATDPSKKSLFSLFKAELELMTPQSNDCTASAMQRLKDREDFEVQDLLALGKAAQSAGPAKQTAVLEILDELCALALRNPEDAFAVPIGILLQNTAQLAYTCSPQASSPANDSLQAGSPFAKKFESYARMLLELSKHASQTTIHSPAVFEWFYAMSFTIAKNADSSEMFVLAAEIAKVSDNALQENSLLRQRQPQCLLAAIACEMRNLECLDKRRLHKLLEVVDQCEACLGNEESTSDSEVEYLNSLYMQRSLMKHLRLQMMLQSDTIHPEKLSYLFRRLITLAESKSVAFEWLEQFVQLAGSLDITVPEDDMEWLVAKAWNIVSSMCILL